MEPRHNIPPEEANSLNVHLRSKVGIVRKTVVYDGGEGQFSYPRLRWRYKSGEEREVMGQRWNGWEGNEVGFPNLRGNPGWIVLPNGLGVGAVADSEARAQAGDPGIRPDGPREAQRWRDTVLEGGA